MASLDITGLVLRSGAFNYGGTSVTLLVLNLTMLRCYFGYTTQINSKQATITGAATTIDDANLTASRALVSNSSPVKLRFQQLLAQRVGYLDGVTSAIQTQLDSKPVAYSAAVTTSSGTATIAHSAHGLGFPANVQVYDENKQLVLVDIRQTVSGGEMTITINAPDATYDVIAVGAGFVS